MRKPDFLCPVHALSSVFKSHFMATLKVFATSACAASASTNSSPVPDDSNRTPDSRRALYRHSWVVYAKTSLGGPAQVLQTLSRYTHRTAIGNDRSKGASCCAASALTSLPRSVSEPRAERSGWVDATSLGILKTPISRRWARQPRPPMSPIQARSSS